MSEIVEKPGNTMKLLKLTAGIRLAGLAGLLACCLGSAFAQEAVIRKNLAERLPSLSKIDEISKTPMNGLYEIRVNETDIFYTDAEGNFLLQGNLLDTQAQPDRGTHRETQRHQF